MSTDLKNLFAALPRTTRGHSLVLGGKADKGTFLYTHNNSVYIRNIQNPAVSDVYSDHVQQATVAKYSPSGFYIASADVSGKVRIWDTVNPEHITKNEFQPFAGPVNDLAWSGDSQRIVAGGQGREKFCHVFSADTGTSVGTMNGHSKPVNSVAFKPNRPFRIATGSEDQTLCFFHGPPFKFNNKVEDHRNFVNCVEYSADGNKFVSAGADGRLYVYDGKTADRIREIGDPAHKGGIYSLAFSPDDKELLTVSGDKTAKIWNVETGELVTEFVMGSTVNDMQLGCLWQGDYILTVSFSGNVNYLDRANPSSPSRVIMGHSKNITCMLAAPGVLYTADADGKVCVWNMETGNATQITGTGKDAHTSQVQAMALCGNTLFTCSVDDTVKMIDTTTGSFTDICVKMSSQPQAVATGSDGYTIVACLKEVLVLQNGHLLTSCPIKFEPSSVTIHPSQSEVAVGGKDMKVHLFRLSTGTLEEVQLLSQDGEVTCVAYSPDGAYLASGDSNRKVCLYDAADSYKGLVTSLWTAHGAKVLCLAWSPNSQYIASGGIDANVFIWDVNNKDNKIKIDRAHKQSAVSCVAWRTDSELASAGHDCNVRIWNVKHN